MKATFPLTVSLLALGLSMAFAGHADLSDDPFANGREDPSARHHDADAPPPRSIRVRMEYIELSHPSLTGLLQGDSWEKADGTVLRDKILPLVAAGEARALETQLVTVMSGGKAVLESTSELIYRTDYSPTECYFSSVPPTPLVFPSLGSPWAAFVPAVFDTRNNGSFLEAIPTSGIGENTLDVSIDSRLSWHTGNSTWVEARDSLGTTGKIECPDFYSVRFSGGLSCPEGKPVLASVQSPRDAIGRMDENRKILVFIRCDTLSVDQES